MTAKGVHSCTEKQRIDELDKLLRGNGKKGLYEQTIELRSSTRTLITSVNNLKTAVRALVKFQTEYETIRAERERMYRAEQDKVAKRYKTISILVSLISISMGVLIAFLK